MTTIVMNTLTGAVTEYDWVIQSATAAQASSSAGLHDLGGDSDAGAPITGEIRSGLMGGEGRQGLESVYVGVKGAGQGIVRIEGESGAWEYPMDVRAGGVSRVQPGKGIEENWLGYGYRNVAGADFLLDSVDAEIVQSKKRRL